MLARTRTSILNFWPWPACCAKMGHENDNSIAFQKFKIAGHSRVNGPNAIVTRCLGRRTISPRTALRESFSTVPQARWPVCGDVSEPYAQGRVFSRRHVRRGITNLREISLNHGPLLLGATAKTTGLRSGASGLCADGCPAVSALRGPPPPPQAGTYESRPQQPH